MVFCIRCVSRNRLFCCRVWLSSLELFIFCVFGRLVKRCFMVWCRLFGRLLWLFSFCRVVNRFFREVWWVFCLVSCWFSVSWLRCLLSGRKLICWLFFISVVSRLLIGSVWGELRFSLLLVSGVLSRFSRIW